MTDKLYWEPVLADEQYAKQLRKDYSHDAHMSDDEILDKYCDSRKYVVTWDHLGDAYHDYEKLADAYLKQQEEIKKLKNDVACERYEHFCTIESEGLAYDEKNIPPKPDGY